MSAAQVYDAPIVPWPLREPTEWEKEKQAFDRMLPELLKTHAGKYVAIRGGKVLGFGDDQIELAMRVYRKHGYATTLVTRVSEMREIIRIPTVWNSPRPSPPLDFTG